MRGLSTSVALSGGVRFALARHCNEVIGIDNSAAFIAAAQKIQSRGSLLYEYFVEGDILRERGTRRDCLLESIAHASPLKLVTR